MLRSTYTRHAPVGLALAVALLTGCGTSTASPTAGSGAPATSSVATVATTVGAGGACSQLKAAGAGKLVPYIRTDRLDSQTCILAKRSDYSISLLLSDPQQDAATLFAQQQQADQSALGTPVPETDVSGLGVTAYAITGPGPNGPSGHSIILKWLTASGSRNQLNVVFPAGVVITIDQLAAVARRLPS